MFNKNNLNDCDLGETQSDAESNTDASNLDSTDQSSTDGSDVDLSHDLISLFECTVCYDYVLPPILQCSSGHLVCVSCRSKLTNCPTCRDPLTDIRNLAMEKVARRLNFPFECNVSSDEIDFKEMIKCPCPGNSCNWQGPLYKALQHLMTSHIATILLGDDIIFLVTEVRTPGPVVWTMVQKCFGSHFIIVLEKRIRNEHEQFFAVVQLIGSRKQADNFVYRFELSGNKQRQLAWEATPLSIHDSVITAMGKSDCLVFETSTAKAFTNDEGNMSIGVTISLV